MIRILLPFAAGWAVLFPLIAALVTVATNLEEPRTIPVKYLQFFSSGEVLRHVDPMHLWFLEYLLIFYTIALAVVPLARRLPALVAKVERTFRAVLISPLGPLVLAALLHDPRATHKILYVNAGEEPWEETLDLVLK